MATSDACSRSARFAWQRGSRNAPSRACSVSRLRRIGLSTAVAELCQKRSWNARNASSTFVVTLLNSSRSMCSQASSTFTHVHCERPRVTAVCGYSFRIDQCLGVRFGFASREEVDQFVRLYYRRRYSRYAPALPRIDVPTVPADFPSKLIGLRLRLHLTQGELARRIGAANKAVIYQWEARKRTPSIVFWARLEELARGDRRPGS